MASPEMDRRVKLKEAEDNLKEKTATKVCRIYFLSMLMHMYLQDA